jgi:hypothetical protein
VRCTLRPVAEGIAGSAVRVYGRPGTTGARSWPRLDGASRKASPGNNTLLRSIETNAEGLYDVSDLMSQVGTAVELTQPSSYSCNRRTS